MVDVMFAARGSRPASTSAASVTKDPPPASAFCTPAMPPASSTSIKSVTPAQPTSAGAAGSDPGLTPLAGSLRSGYRRGRQHVPDPRNPPRSGRLHHHERGPHPAIIAFAHTGDRVATIRNRDVCRKEVHALHVDSPLA